HRAAGDGEVARGRRQPASRDEGGDGRRAAPGQGPREVIRRRRAALVLALSALLAATATAQTTPPERPTYAVGDAWSLTDGAYRLARIERGGTYVFTAAGDREIWLTRDLAVTYVKRGSDTIEIQDPPRVSWPLTAGK